MATRHRPLDGMRIGIFGKGGCGKSTATVLLAKAMRQRRYDVCVLDADSTNLGLHLGLGLEKIPTALVDYFGGMVFSGGLVTCPVDDPTPLPGAKISLADLPREYVGTSPEGILLLVAGKLGGLGPGAGCDGPIVKIARDFRLADTSHRFVTLVDFKAGFEDPARGAITSLDLAIVVVDPTLAAVQMAVHLTKLVEQIQMGGQPATAHLEDPELVEIAHRIYRETSVQHVLPVLNRVANRDIERQLRAALDRHRIAPIGAIRHDPAVALAWLQGTVIDSPAAMSDAMHVLDALERRIAPEPTLDTSPESPDRHLVHTRHNELPAGELS